MFDADDGRVAHDGQRRDGRFRAEGRNESVELSRRDFFRQAGATSAAIATGGSVVIAGPEANPTRDKALIAITLDLEMSRNFPTWETTHWDYEKGNLDADTKAYAVEAARRVKEH